MLHAFRLKPGSDLREGLEQWINDHGIEAGTIVTCVGSLSTATLRRAAAEATNTFPGPFEIVSLVGTLSINGCHCHVAVADRTGQVVGGILPSDARSTPPRRLSSQCSRRRCLNDPRTTRPVTTNWS